MVVAKLATGSENVDSNVQNLKSHFGTFIVNLLEGNNPLKLRAEG